MIEPPRTIVHRTWTVYDGTPWLKVTRNEITTPDGLDRTHHAIQLNTVATVIAVDEHRRALLMRRHRWIVDTIGLESPGGIVDPDEEPLNCARRELLEETGFEIDELTLVADLEPMPGLVRTRHLVYLGSNPRQVAMPTDAEEAAQLLWIPLAETTALLAKGMLLGSGTAVGMLTAAALFKGEPTTQSPGQQFVALPESH
ncbi:NUDIX hydrolase [Nocardia fluminea]|uniref:ADP-ribose pyrophosphatase YjhB (NUDIX family) n=1 Tax=Nocardia fluminea TaxID=134984 RepID=A0A2N3VFS5_9NOCA|nr:NUDIX hydrolase [Nocardia fluminea]PKV80473.1 ADP-ribose pyrophosphatase YjhB (NUDIX family) [Nocardia fluminea]